MSTSADPEERRRPRCSRRLENAFGSTATSRIAAIGGTLRATPGRQHRRRPP